jgi:class 3 adenylate cyclase/predicted ATPase
MQQIADWLKKLGMAEYAQRFAENRIDLSVLPDLTDQDLEKMGVLLGDRRKMLRAIRDLDTTSVAVSAPSAPVAAEPTRRDSAERRQLTVMFTDLVGSTALSTKLDPEELREIISAYHRRCAEVIVKHGGFVARYMGDGVLAYFGYPYAHEDDGERAVHAGLALVGASTKLDAGSRPSLQMRVGIATGLVVVGDLVPDDPAHECEVVGETPNLAARLQALAEPDTVVIDSNTCCLLGKLFEYRVLGPVSIRGFGGPVPVWQVIGASTVHNRFEALRTATTPLVGRDEEIDLLMRRWEQAKRADGAVVLISGEPGIGKSRIAQTIAEGIGGEPHARLRYFCSPHHQDSAFYPSIAQLERAAGFRRDDTGDQRLDKLKAVLALGSNDLSEAVPLLAELLSIPTGDRYPPLNLSPQRRKEKTLHAQLAQVEALAARQPVLMVWEDVQWSDPTTRESLDLLIDRVPTLRVLVIITFRPEFAPPWVGRPHVTLLSLSRLPARQRLEIIVHVAGSKRLPREIADQIVDRTDGVPLFIEELTKAVVERGIVMETRDGYAADRPVAQLAIPSTLHASLLARLDRSAPARDVAQIAAALGRSFSHELISAVAAVLHPQLDSALDQLVRAELIFRRGTPPDAEYAFKHALLQDAAYDTLLRGRRQQLHGRIAAVLEERFPEIVDSQPTVLAQHCTEAGLIEKAVGYRFEAGRQAMRRSAMTEAVTQLQKALEMLAAVPEGPWRQQQEVDLQIALTRALTATKGYSAPAVGESIARTHALAAQIVRSEHLLSLLGSEFAFHLIRAEHKLALSFAERIEKIGETRNDVGTQLSGRHAKGWTCWYLGEFIAARELLEQCHGLADPTHRFIAAGRVDPYPVMLSHLAVTLAFLGYIDQARSRMNEALAEARQLEHAQTLCDVLMSACLIEVIIRSLEMRRRAEDLLKHSEELLTLSTAHGFLFFSGWATVFRGSSLTVFGRTQEGLTLIAQGLAAIRATGGVAGTSGALLWLAAAYAVSGQPVEGLNCLAEAAQIIQRTEERIGDAEVHRLRGDLLNATGDRAAAERSYRQALGVAERQHAKVWQLRAATSLARLWCNQGKRTEARDLLAPIYGWFTEGFDTPILQEAKALLHELV